MYSSLASASKLLWRTNSFLGNRPVSAASFGSLHIVASFHLFFHHRHPRKMEFHCEFPCIHNKKQKYHNFLLHTLVSFWRVGFETLQCCGGMNLTFFGVQINLDLFHWWQVSFGKPFIEQSISHFWSPKIRYPAMLSFDLIDDLFGSQGESCFCGFVAWF